MERVSADDFSNEGIPYLGARHVRVAGVPCLALRIGFVGELGYELHFPSPHAEHVWDTLLGKGADLGVAPFGLEPQRILRLEKGHSIVSHDTDSESNLLEAAMPWLVKNDKEFEWVGKWATQQVAERGLRWLLVGFESPSGAMPVEGGQVVVDGCPSGRVTSRAALRGAREGDRARDRARIELAVDGAALRRAGQRPAGRDARPTRPVLRPLGRTGQGVSGALDFLSPSLAAGRRRLPSGRPLVAASASSAPPARPSRSATAGSSRRPCQVRPSGSRHVGIADLSHLGKLDVRPRRPPDVERDGDDLPSLAATRARALSPTRGAARAARDRGLPLAVDVDRGVHRRSRDTGPEARALLATADPSP